MPRTLGGNDSTDGHPLVHQSGQRHTPTVARLTEHFIVRNTYVGEVHLVELGFACHLIERPHLDTRGVHVDHEGGEAGMFHCLGLGAHHQQSPAGQMRQRGPNLLTVHDPLVAVALTLGGETREV